MGELLGISSGYWTCSLGSAEHPAVPGNYNVQWSRVRRQTHRLPPITLNQCWITLGLAQRVVWAQFTHCTTHLWPAVLALSVCLRLINVTFIRINFLIIIVVTLFCPILYPSFTHMQITLIIEICTNRLSYHLWSDTVSFFSVTIRLIVSFVLKKDIKMLPYAPYELLLCWDRI